MSQAELTPADYFARADVGQPEQKSILENELLDPRFARLNAQLETIKGRLEQFVKGPSRSLP